jgi:hypothetical protein
MGKNAMKIYAALILLTIASNTKTMERELDFFETVGVDKHIAEKIILRTLDLILTRENLDRGFDMSQLTTAKFFLEQLNTLERTDGMEYFNILLAAVQGAYSRWEKIMITLQSLVLIAEKANLPTTILSIIIKERFLYKTPIPKDDIPFIDRFI